MWSKKTDSLLTIPMLRYPVFDITHLHVEVSSKCVLKCPRCPRTELKEDHPQINRDYSLEEFQTIFSQDILSKIKYLNFCGDIGDPIYATDFLEIVEYVKSTSPNTCVNIVTNGSYKNAHWWIKLGECLSSSDRVTFSIDGWDHDSNRIYRVNSDWDSIMLGLKTLRDASAVNIRWSTIIFRFNLDRLDQIKNLAASMGVDQFDLVRSMKFGSNDSRYLGSDGVDPLEPLGQTEARRYYRSSNILNRSYTLPTVPRDTTAWQSCLNGSQMPFISVDGRFFPCAWFGSGYLYNDFLDKYTAVINVRTRGVADVITDPCWQELKMRWEMFPPDICRFKCKNG